MNILNNDRIELTCDDYKLEYTLTLYDVYGHYVEEVKLSKEDIIDLYRALEKLKL